MQLFDRKFGAEFLAGVPPRPGVYRFYDAAGTLLYVGKARDLRRRLGQYRTARRSKTERKGRALVRLAARIAWDVCESELDASLTEVRLIQTLRPRENIASAFPFLVLPGFAWVDRTMATNSTPKGDGRHAGYRAVPAAAGS